MDIPKIYADFIQWIGDGTGLPDTILHIHAGMAVLLLARIVTRRSLATPVPLLSVVVAEVANEVMDRLRWGSWRWPDTSIDLVNTLFWPGILFLGLRWRRLHPTVERPAGARPAA